MFDTGLRVGAFSCGVGATFFAAGGAVPGELSDFNGAALGALFLSAIPFSISKDMSGIAPAGGPGFFS
jgi:hypothetical protein